MKKIPLRLLILAFFSASILCVRAEGNFSTIVEAYRNRLNASSLTYYSIWTPENPVTVAEYCYFLNQNDEATDDAYWYEAQYFYDHHLMEGSDAVMIRSIKQGWLANSYHYTVRLGCEDQIIESLESEVAGKFFSKWKSHLSVGELCSYINQWIIEESYFSGDIGVSFEEKAQAASLRRNAERQAQLDSRNYYKHHK